MKKILTTAILCVGLLSMTSCGGFLDEEPQSTLTYQDFYKTQSHIEGNLNYMYRQGATRSIAKFESAYVSSFASTQSFLTGYFASSYEGQEMTCKYSRELTRQQNTVTVSATMNEVWKDGYRIVNMANGSIANIPNIRMDSEATTNRLMGEAKFFRAFNYFYLVKTFGDIPLYTTFNSSSEDDLFLDRSPAEEVYQLVESDLKEAIASLPDATFAANGHRITKYVAAMVLADVYMTQGKYAEAATYAKIVINSPHKLTANGDLALNSAFNKLRSTDDLDEAIYVREYDAAVNKSDWLPTFAFNSSATSVFNSYSIFERIYGPTDHFLNMYEKNDLRIQPNQFFHWEYTNPVNGKKWSSKEACCWYYYDEEATVTTGRGTKDWNFYRYAEALLDGAEAIAQSTGVTAEAAGYLAQVQARANMEGKTADQIAVDLQKLSKQAFIEACWTERLREFPLEFKIWDDCVRTGKFPVISKTTPGKVEYVNLVGAQNASGATFKASDLLWPISVNEIQRNPGLLQNDGYSRE